MSRVLTTLMILSYLSLLMIGCDFNIGTTDPFRDVTITSTTSVPKNTVPFEKMGSSTPTPKLTFVAQRTKNSSTTPTISSTKVEAIIVDRLKNNDGCALPCWWNISPGVSTSSEMNIIFSPLAKRLTNTKNPDGTTAQWVGITDLFNYQLSLQIEVLERANIVEAMIIESHSNNDLKLFSSVWYSYSIDQIVNTYGPPSKVWIQTYKDQVQPPGNPSKDYGLLVVYDLNGFALLYQGKYGDGYSLCPTYTNSGNINPSIQVVLTTKDPIISLEDLIGERGGIPSSLITIQEAAGISPEKFASFLLMNDDRKCFKTDPKIWP